MTLHPVYRADVARLLALPAKWAAADDALPSSALTEDRGWVRAQCEADLRAAIERELRGEGTET
jgi:hypothetical protein